MVVRTDETFDVHLEWDTEERAVNMLEALSAASAQDDVARAVYAGLTYKHRKEFARRVAQAKREETRQQRRQALKMLRGTDAKVTCEEIFISYSSRDAEIARRLQRLLELAPIGARIWRDERAIERDWSREIAQALAASRVVVVLWSAKAAESPWVRHEWLTARALEKPIVPIVIDGSRLPRGLENLHGVMAAADLPADVIAQRLAAALAAPAAYDPAG